MSSLHDITPQIAELMRKMRQTANRSLRASYAEQAKAHLAKAEEVSDKSNTEEQAGIRKLRNELIEMLDTQFPISQRKADLKVIKGPTRLEKAIKGAACSFGIIEGDTINKGPSWVVIAALAGLFFMLGRSTKKAYRKMMRRRRK
jgi:hypothetical protein